MLSREPAGRVGGGRRLLTVLAVLALLALITLRGLATFWTDYLWFSSVELTQVWWVLVASRLLLATTAALVAFVFIWANLVVADRISPRLGIFGLASDEELVERFQEWVEPRIRRVRLGMSALLALLIGLGAAAWWEDLLLFANAVSFGTTDPIFGLDLSFYVFRLPFYRDLFGWFFQLLVITALVVAALHYLNGGIRLQSDFQRVSPGVKVHLSVLLAGLALLKAIGYRLDTYDLLYSTRGAVFGATYTDVHAQLPALNLLALIMLVAAVILLVNIRFRGWTLPAVAGGLWLATAVVVGGIIPAAVQRFLVEPAELSREQPFVVRSIAFTRQAYDLDGVEVRPFAASGDLEAADLEANAATIDNIRLWDPVVLEDTYSQLQEIRTYYTVMDVDVDRYLLGDLTQVMVSMRELDEANLPSDTWINRRLIYTHGYGAVVSPANDVTAEGLPAFYVKDIPPQTSQEQLAIDQPGVYFGEAFDPGDFVIVDTREQEVDFPQGSAEGDVQYSTYEGEDGVMLSNLVRRAGFALRFGDFNTLISNRLTSESRLLMARNVRQRVEKVAPFLHTDNDPYVVVIDGRLVWVVDLYTTTARYPYSRPADVSRLSPGSGLPFRFNYVRNSVKATVDAYDGTMTFYLVDPTDPLVLAYQRIFPDLFEDGAALSDELRAHLRYPEDLFRVQSDMYRLYHMTDPQVFYNNEDPWEIPPDPSTTGAGQTLRGEATNLMVPYYLLMRLPAEEDLSFLILQPFNPRDRPNMISFLVAKSGPEDYGEIVEFELPRQRLIDGPGQVGARINQDPVIARERTLLGQQGSEFIQGNLLVVPIEESILYIQPVYLRGTQVALPEFKFAIVVFGDEVVMRESLDLALADLFGTPVEEGERPEEAGEPLAGAALELLRLAEAAFEEAEEALRAGDLATYAERVAEARRLVEEALAVGSAP
ncbi:MAG: UPF0182 family protein [Acidimicrobiia bacterium]